MRKFEYIEHTADIGIRAFGKSLPELFENAALGMAHVFAEPGKATKDETYTVEVEAKDLEELLVNWLNEILYRFNKNKIIPASAKIEHIDNNRLKGTVNGEKYDSSRHNLKREIKSTTYHMLKIKKKDFWEATVIFDV